jgi:hypothetical protein
MNSHHRTARVRPPSSGPQPRSAAVLPGAERIAPRRPEVPPAREVPSAADLLSPLAGRRAMLNALCLFLAGQPDSASP